MRAYAYLVFTSQVQARLSIVGNSASAMDAGQAFKSMYHALFNEECPISVDTDRYHSVLEHALSKANFSTGTSIYLLPSNLNLNIQKTARQSNKILISNMNMKTGSSRNIDKAEFNIPSFNYLWLHHKHMLFMKCIHWRVQRVRQ